MADSKKRKETSRDDKDNRGPKRSKGGSGGKWQTPNQIAKAGSRGSGKIEPGDAGIWVTCAKNQERRATEELTSMFEECAERFYGIKPTSEEKEDDGSEEDIEASIRKEIASMSSNNGKPKLFSPVAIDLPCVIFFKVQPVIDPIDFVYKICEEIVAKPGIRRMRYVNRLTPVAMTGKATEKGLEEIGRTLLGKDFELSVDGRKEKGIGGTSEEGKVEGKLEEGATATIPSYAIRPTTRAHNTLQRGAVINQIAGMIGSNHKVNLTTPDKVIIVEIYQTVCGMSVVQGNWETLKRFNLAELYQNASKPAVLGPPLKSES